MFDRFCLFDSRSCVLAMDIDLQEVWGLEREVYRRVRDIPPITLLTSLISVVLGALESSMCFVLHFIESEPEIRTTLFL